MISKNEILAKIAEVEDPEIQLGVVDLGLIYDVAIIDDRDVRIKMTLTFPGCPYGPTLVAEVKEAVMEIGDVKKVDVEVVWEPPWDPATMASEYARDVLGIW